MIGYLKGKIINLEESSVIIETNGIGWSVNIVKAYEYFLDTEISLYIHTHVRENEIALWGFKTFEELRIFNLLISVSGVGPKSAQSLLEQKGIQEIVYAVANGDHKGIKVAGIGDKTAQKIVIELKNKVGKSLEAILESKSKNLSNTSVKIPNDVYSEAMAALVSLGYKEVDIAQSINELINTEEITSSQELIKKVLKLL
jgi:Holliday junction DNA helicase RuvA